MKAGGKIGSEEGLPIPRDARKHAVKPRRAPRPATTLPTSIGVLVRVHFFLAVAILPAWGIILPLAFWCGCLSAFWIVVGISIGQTTLLCTWGILGVNPWPVRIGCVVAGVGYEGLLLGVGTCVVGAIVTAGASTLMVAVLLLARFFGLRLSAGPIPHKGLAPMQFYIRHLLVSTFVVACVLSLGQCLRPLLRYDRESLSTLAELASASVALAAIGIGSVYAVFGNRHPLLAGIGFVFLAACTGSWLAQHGVVNGIPFLATVSTFVESVVLVVSLLVFRAEGYRLARLPSFREGDSRGQHP